jgi:hypothetical protein
MVLIVAWATASALGCGKQAGLDALKDSKFFCRASLVPNATTNADLMTRGGDPIYFYGECLPTEAQCMSRATDERFEQPVAFCYKETVLTGDDLYWLCLSAHVCSDWRKTRLRDMGDRVKGDCEMLTSAEFAQGP